jgi:hypothetical protein
MLEVERDEALRTSLAERGKRFQLAELSASSMVERYIDVYSQLLTPQAALAAHAGSQASSA